MGRIGSGRHQPADQKRSKDKAGSASLAASILDRAHFRRPSRRPMIRPTTKSIERSPLHSWATAGRGVKLLFSQCLDLRIVIIKHWGSSVDNTKQLLYVRYGIAKGNRICDAALPGVARPGFDDEMGHHSTSAHDRPIDAHGLRLLLVEDDDRTAEHVASSLREAGWHVVRANEGEDGYARAIGTHYDVLVIDRMLPRLDGMALVRALRAAGRQTPALFLTTMSGIDDRIEGLEAGGDDYLVKPFAHGELVARVKALVRRSRIGVETCKLRLADLEVDTLGRRARRAGQDIELQPREFELLEYLLRHAGDVVTRKQLLETVWNFRFVPQTNIVESHMSRLRSKLDRGFDRRLIETVRGVGYVLRDPAS